MDFRSCTVIGPLYAGEEPGWTKPAPDRLLICADGGYSAALRYNLQPDLLIGDLDSLPEAERPESGKIPVILLPEHKDDTDLAVCVAEGRRRGCSCFFLLGVLGGRMAHTIASLQVAYDCAMRGEEVWLADRQNRLTILLPGSHTLTPMRGRKLSLLAYTPEVNGVCLSGTEWELDNATLTARYPLGCSNEARAAQIRLCFESGALVYCCSRDRQEEDGWHRC